MPDGAFGATSSQSFGSLVDWSTFTITGGPQRFVIAADPPNAPGNLAFTVAGNAVVLTWSPPAPGPTVNTYVVEAGSGAGQSDITRFDTGSTASTLTVTNVPAGTYFVRVRAANVDGAGSASNEVTIVVGSGPCPPPVAPTGLTGSASGNTVTLQWNAAAGAVAYFIEAGSASAASDLASFDTGNPATSFAANAPTGTYFIRVRARTACGTSGVSNEVVVTAGGAPPPPGPDLSGLWQGTLDVREPGGTTRRQIEIDFTHAGTRLTGSVRNTGTPPVSFDLTQSASNPQIFEGTMLAPRDTEGCETKPGSLTAQSLTRLTGTFASPCGTNEIDVTKVP